MSRNFIHPKGLPMNPDVVRIAGRLESNKVVAVAVLPVAAVVVVIAKCILRCALLAALAPPFPSNPLVRNRFIAGIASKRSGVSYFLKQKKKSRNSPVGNGRGVFINRSIPQGCALCYPGVDPPKIDQKHIHAPNPSKKNVPKAPANFAPGAHNVYYDSGADDSRNND
jgi:hypothetical protein